MKYYLVDKHWNFVQKDGELDFLIAEVNSTTPDKRDKEPNVSVQITKIFYKSGWFSDHVEEGKWVNISWSDIRDSTREVIAWLLGYIK